MTGQCYPLKYIYGYRILTTYFSHLIPHSLEAVRLRLSINYSGLSTNIAASHRAINCMWMLSSLWSYCYSGQPGLCFKISRLSFPMHLSSYFSAHSSSKAEMKTQVMLSPESQLCKNKTMKAKLTMHSFDGFHHQRFS